MRPEQFDLTPPGSEGPAPAGNAYGVSFGAASHPAGHLDAGVLGTRRANRMARRKERRVKVAQAGGVIVFAGAALVLSASKVGSLDMALTATPTYSLQPTEPASATATLPAEQAGLIPPISVSVEPSVSVAGGSWSLVWALTPADPATSAGVWPGTPWPGNPGRSVIGVATVLDGVQPGSAFVVDDGFWVVYEVRVVDPGDWEQLVEQPVEAAEVLLYELGDTPGRGRVALLAREGGR